ncbi:MAG: putative phosphoesterase [Halobacteriales archaeon]|jgi:putative phosphoesterase
MKVGIISDVHSNRVALERVLEDMPPVDDLLCAGDVVGYNPWPGECVDALRGVGELGSAVRRKLRDDRSAVPTVAGNHDRAVAGGSAFGFNKMASAGVEHAKDRLTEAQNAWIERLPTERTEFDGRVKIVHGHPDDPDRYTYPDDFSPTLLEDEDVLILGHTHVQDADIFDDGIVMNPGSVGQPRDQNPRAAYAVLDLDAMAVNLHRVAYNVDAVRDAVQEAGLPSRIGDRLVEGR